MLVVGGALQHVLHYARHEVLVHTYSLAGIVARKKK